MLGVVRVQAIERKTPIALAALAAIALTTVSAADAAPKKPARRPAPTARRSVVRVPVARAATSTPAATPAVPLARPIGNPGEWFPIESYPPEARVAGQEGRTVFALDIDAKGRIAACHIVKTSGSDLLDSTTCSQLIANGRFTPATDANARPVAGQWRSAMRWQLQAGGVEE